MSISSARKKGSSRSSARAELVSAVITSNRLSGRASSATSRASAQPWKGPIDVRVPDLAGQGVLASRDVYMKTRCFSAEGALIVKRWVKSTTVPCPCRDAAG